MSTAWSTIVTPIIAAIAGGVVSHYGLPFLNLFRTQKTYYRGVAEDIGHDLDNSFHPALFTYSFDRVLISISGNRVKLRGSVVTTSKNNPGEKSTGEIIGFGKMIDGRASIEYKGEYLVSNEKWRGVAIIHIPQAGPAKGYWMSFHVNEKGAYYSMGSIKLERLGKA